MLAVVLGVASLFGAQEVRAAHARARQAWLLFDSARTGRSEIYAVSASGTADLHQLTFGGGRAPRPAPNGRFVLFDHGGDTWVMRADGRHERLLLRGGSQAAWAPDSRHVAYVALSGGIRIAELGRSNQRVLTMVKGDRDPHWAPHGKAVALLNGTRLVLALGGRRHVLAAGVTGAFAWSPDGGRIAFRSSTRLALVNADGTGRSTLVDPWSESGDLPDGPAWSPNGQEIAYTDDGVIVVDAGSGHVTKPELGGPYSEPVWNSDGREIAFVDTKSNIDTSVFSGPPSARYLGDSRPAWRPFGLAWTIPPAGTHYRLAAPANDTAVVTSASELRVKAPIDEIAANRNRVAFISCYEVGTWRPGDRSFLEVRRDRPLCTDNSAHTDERLWDVTLANDLVGYGDEVGEAGGYAWVALSDPNAPTAAAISGPTSGGIGSTGIGFLLGHGPMLVFSTMRGFACNGSTSPCPSPEGQPLWRVPLPLANGECTQPVLGGDPSPPCVKLAAGPVEPLAVDDTRVVVRHLDGTIAVIDGTGQQLLSLPLNTGQGTSAAIDGSDLVLLLHGALLDYDAITGTLLHQWPMPLVLNSGGLCGTYLCGRAELRLQDVENGLAAYILDGRLHLLRLRDGADVAVGPATAVQLGDIGLFYAYNGAAPYVGRIRFVPFDKLPLTSGARAGTSLSNSRVSCGCASCSHISTCSCRCSTRRSTTGWARTRSRSCCGAARAGSRAIPTGN